MTFTSRIDEKDKIGTVTLKLTKITEAFEVFDHECNKTVDVREIGTIIRSLGCCPNEADLHDMLAEVEEEEPTGFIRLEKFLPMMTRVLMERRYRPIPEDVLLRAFEVLDQNKSGHLTKDDLVKYMTEEGKTLAKYLLKLILFVEYDTIHNLVEVPGILQMYIAPGHKNIPILIWRIKSSLIMISDQSRGIVSKFHIGSNLCALPKNTVLM
uniref:EF-hand calcium binding domain 2 n=1 Tax=Pseudonaja textilis TaxID=8673 RepID=A0A670ZCY6_PSETE